MSHKEMCQRWVERRKYQREDGKWQECGFNGQPIDKVFGKVYETEQELDDVLWDKVISLSSIDL